MDRNPRALGVIAAVVIAGLSLAFVGTALATDRPQFCPSCHEMRPYFDAWESGPHSDAWCIDCHVEPGMQARFAHKFVALKEVYSHVIGDTTFPRAATPAVPDERCLNCHEDMPDQIDGFPHAAHAEKGRCAQCHYRTGHDVSDRTLQAAGIFNPTVKVQRLSGRTATVGAGSANLDGHRPVGCSECHNMQTTACGSCHKPTEAKHPTIGTQACTTCHPPTGASWEFIHPEADKDCARCHEAPAKHRSGPCEECHKRTGTKWKFFHPGGGSDCPSCHKTPASHPSGACRGCHRNAGRSWAFAHPGTGGEHSYRSFACKRCHPASYNRAYCTCHNGRPPDD